MLFGQTFDAADLGTISLLVLLEGVLSVDNALMLGVLASRVPPDRARSALTYGLIGAFIFRVVALALVGVLLHWPALKLLGAGYLIYLSIRHFFFAEEEVKLAEQPGKHGFLWSVIGIELTDLAFAVDNILAAVALVGSPPKGWPPGRPHPKLWVILIGGFLGIILTRFAASFCVGLLRRFPRLESAAYWIVLLVAVKLVVEWMFGPRGLDFQDAHTPAFWAFWCALAACLAIGFIPRRGGASLPDPLR